MVRLPLKSDKKMLRMPNELSRLGFVRTCRYITQSCVPRSYTINQLEFKMLNRTDTLNATLI